MGNSRRWRRQLRTGSVLYLMPEIPDDASAKMKDALAVRNAATVTGKCRCGAEMRLTGTYGPGIYRAVFKHQNDCPAVLVGGL